MEPWLAAILLGVIFSAAGWLLSNKDKKQGEEIAQLRADLKTETEKREAAEAELYKLHNIDAQNLLRLELEISKTHHTKDDLNKQLDSLRSTFVDGFKGLGDSIRQMMQDHVETHHKHKGE